MDIDLKTMTILGDNGEEIADILLLDSDGECSCEAAVVLRAVKRRWCLEFIEAIDRWDQCHDILEATYGSVHSDESNAVIRGRRGEAIILRTCPQENMMPFYGREPTVTAVELERKIALLGGPNDWIEMLDTLATISTLLGSIGGGMPEHPEAVYAEWKGWGDFLGIPESPQGHDELGHPIFLRGTERHVLIEPLPADVNPGTWAYSHGGFDCFCGKHGLFKRIA